MFDWDMKRGSRNTVTLLTFKHTGQHIREPILSHTFCHSFCHAIAHILFSHTHRTHPLGHTTNSLQMLGVEHFYVYNVATTSSSQRLIREDYADYLEEGLVTMVSVNIVKKDGIVPSILIIISRLQKDCHVSNLLPCHMSN